MLCAYRSARLVSVHFRQTKAIDNIARFTHTLYRNMSSTGDNKPKGGSKKDRLVWVDLEMTGLKVETDQILEMACLVTDADLNIIAESDDLIIHQPDSVLDNMNDWCKEHHGKSGLTEAVRKSTVSLGNAEMKMLNFIKTHTLKGSSPMAGNSIHMDKAFLVKYMPKFMDHLHYRLVDVSTVKELSRRWFPDEYKNAPEKKGSHRALDDIKESIEELKYYRNTVFKPD